MSFELTDKLTNQIIEALENQEQEFVVDAENSTLVCKESVSSDNANYYSLPQWNSTEGFNLRQEFVSNLHAPLVREELQKILHSGRGVFKNFKLTLKQYPEVEKLWNNYKYKFMINFINDWYNELREIWGLEKLDNEPEDIEDLVQDDFIFQKYNSKLDAELILHNVCADYTNNDNDYSVQINKAIIELWERQFLYGNSYEQIGFICRTLSNEFAGCITVAPVSEKTTNIVTITSYFVPENLRGLGIGTKLLSMCLSELKSLKKEWILLTHTIVPDSLQPLLLRSGFEKIGSGFIAKIQ
mgnify:FL=1